MLQTARVTYDSHRCVLGATLLLIPLEVFAVGTAQAGAANTGTTSFTQAKRHLETIYADHQVTLYCGCPYESRSSIDFTGCRYAPEPDQPRAHRVEWEHVVPVQVFGRAFEAWQLGDARCVNSKGLAYTGRRCASKVDPRFRAMESDMYNLYPAIGKLNELRSHRSMGEIDGEERRFGGCDFELDHDRVEPSTDIRGDIARTYQYMDSVYPGFGLIQDDDRAMFENWSEIDPVDDWECERARRIAMVQGNVNAFVDEACAAREALREASS
ncbi:MAG: endonuclease [Deltaproteobacteria bacterium]|nr:endonuclease [Deltaproteobacteria bacterium]